MCWVISNNGLATLVKWLWQKSPSRDFSGLNRILSQHAGHDFTPNKSQVTLNRLQRLVVGRKKIEKKLLLLHSNKRSNIFILKYNF